MKFLLKFPGLVVLLNILSYALGAPLEKWLIFDHLVGAMGRVAQPVGGRAAA